MKYNCLKKGVIDKQIPDGCYVSYSNPNYCYNSPTGFYEWTAFSNDTFTTSKYGNAMGTIINKGRKDLDKCEADYTGILNKYNNLVNSYNTLLDGKNSCDTQYSGLANSYNSIEANRQEWIAYGNSQAALAQTQKKLISKLKKACGTKCKKIK